MNRSDMMDLTKQLARSLIESHPDYTEVFKDEIILSNQFHYVPPYKAEYDIAVLDNTKKKKRKR